MPIVWPNPLTINVVPPGDYGNYNGPVWLGVSPAEARHITLIHNQLRRIVASGALSNLPPAADMLRLNYDIGLAWRAQVHSQNCQFEHGCIGCGNVENFMGQNLFLEPGAEWDNTMMTWFNEFEQAGGDIVSNYNFSPDNGHFTQMVWSRNAKIGCGVTECPNLGGRYMVCNYAPGGNMVGQPVYLQGDSCSQCPEGIPCEPQDGETTPRLCGTGQGFFPWGDGKPNRLVQKSNETTAKPE
ncbi:scoloptoxin SSD976-like [Haemaphysalis longicornis]